MKKTLKLLMVEDSEVDAELLIHELKRNNYELNLQRVETPEDLESALNDKEWDIVLSDFSLPKMNGFDSLRIFKESKKDIPFILVTGSIGEEKAVDIMRQGANDYVIKNHLTRLTAAIKRELESAKIRRGGKEAEEKILMLQKRMEYLISASPVVIYSCNNKWQATFISENVIDLWGYTAEEFLKDSDFWEKHLHPEDRKPVLEKLSHLTDKGLLTLEYRFLLKNGNYKWTLDRIKLICNEKENFLECVGSCVDIAELKKADEELKTRMKELEEFYEMSVGREIKMAELKQEIEQLKGELKKGKSQ